MARKPTKADLYYESIKDDRNEWRDSVSQSCMGCGWQAMLQIHEMERRSHASGRWGDRSNYLLLCQRCHDGAFATMSHARQLAHKLLCDTKHFDLQAWLMLRDPDLQAPERVTMRDIAAHLTLRE